MIRFPYSNFLFFALKGGGNGDYSVMPQNRAGKE